MQHIKRVTGRDEFIQNFKGKKVDFLLALCVTDTCKIEGITQAGIPGLIPLTPTLDAEFLCNGAVKSLPEIAKTPSGVPTPALITRAVQLLQPFERLEILDLGVAVKPKIENRIHDFAIKPSDSIQKGANIDAQKLFEKGRAFGESYRSENEYIILAESTPAGTTTAEASARALGYKVDNCFSSSYKNVPKNIKSETIASALKIASEKEDSFGKLGICADNMLLFVAGFVAEVSKRYRIALAGGTQMASSLLICSTLKRELGLEIESQNIALLTTKWLAEDVNSDIKKLLEMLDFELSAYYADFDFHASKSEILKTYDRGEAKEGVGAGGALCYALANGIKREQIIKTIEGFFG